jgi:signal transduction histidine kinase
LQLVDRDVDDARLQNVVTRGRSALARVQRLVAGLLEFARAGAAPAEGARAELRAVVDDVVGGLEPVAQDAGVSLAIENVPSVDVRCSPGVLTSLVSNLVQNAIKYMGESSVRTVTVRAIERGKCVRVEVEDTGPGLPPGLEPTVFEPYVRGGRSSQPGLGLGLATVKRVACSHHGAVGVEPGPNGTGARFWFEIPRADEDSS